MAALLFTGCDEQPRYSNLPCSFNLNLSLHADKMLLRAALDTPQEFVTIDIVTDNVGRKTLNINSQSGRSEQIVLTTEKEKRSIGTVGSSQSLIVGCSPFTTDDNGGRRAWDRQCPACYADLGGTRHKLTWAEQKMHMTCPTCQRDYELSYGTSDDGKYRLEEFAIQTIQTTDGTIVSIHRY